MPDPSAFSLPDDAAAIDRRAEARLQCSLVVACSVPLETESRCIATVRDISAGGIGLVTAQSFPSGTVLTIQLRIDDRVILSKPLRLRHVRKEGPANWFLGGSFLERLTKKEMKLFL